VFEVRRRQPRKAHNPRTGKAVEVPAKLVVAFKAGREMEIDQADCRSSGSLYLGGVAA
jgi:nucleoid DNA-binding protein